jgi:hypothetical protein
MLNLLQIPDGKLDACYTKKGQLQRFAIKKGKFGKVETKKEVTCMET